MKRAYILYCRIVAAVFLINTFYPVLIKLSQQRLAHDWFHSFLHLLCALFGAYAGWRAKSVGWAKAFTWIIGMLYMVLGVHGWFVPGLFLNSPLAIPLGAIDNIFHLLLSVPALVIIVFELVSAQKLLTTSAALKQSREKSRSNHRLHENS